MIPSREGDAVIRMHASNDMASVLKVVSGCCGADCHCWGHGGLELQGLGHSGGFLQGTAAPDTIQERPP